MKDVFLFFYLTMKHMQGQKLECHAGVDQECGKGIGFLFHGSPDVRKHRLGLNSCWHPQLVSVDQRGNVSPAGMWASCGHHVGILG